MSVSWSRNKRKPRIKLSAPRKKNIVGKKTNATKHIVDVARTAAIREKTILARTTLVKLDRRILRLGVRLLRTTRLRISHRRLADGRFRPTRLRLRPGFRPRSSGRGRLLFWSVYITLRNCTTIHLRGMHHRLLLRTDNRRGRRWITMAHLACRRHLCGLDRPAILHLCGTAHLLVLSLSGTAHLLVLSLSGAAHLLVLSLSGAAHLLVMSLPGTAHLLVLSLSKTAQLLVLSLSGTAHLLPLSGTAHLLRLSTSTHLLMGLGGILLMLRSMIARLVSVLMRLGFGFAIVSESCGTIVVPRPTVGWRILSNRCAAPPVITGCAVITGRAVVTTRAARITVVVCGGRKRMVLDRDENDVVSPMLIQN